MSRKSSFTTITPLPSTISRETAVEALHDHILMIDLNPLVVERKLVPKAPHFASAEEYNCQWYLITDRVSYMPGRIVTGKVDYYACFHDLADGMQTHCFAPLGLDIRSRWRVAGSLPGEPREPTELGLGIPKEGLYIREDVQLKCNIMLTSFVKRTFKKAHERLVDRLGERSHVVETDKHNSRVMRQSGAFSLGGASTPSTGPGSPPLASTSPRFSATTTMRPESPGSHYTGHSSYYGAPPALAAQMAQAFDPTNPPHHQQQQQGGYISPLFHQMDPAYRIANPYDNTRPVSTQHPYDPSTYGNDMKMGYHHPQGQYQQPMPPPPPHQMGYPHVQAPQPGAVEIGSGELQHPAARPGGPPVPAKLPYGRYAPAEMEG